MKKLFFILAIFASLLVGAGTATAYDYYWAKSGNTYSCQGYPGAAICRSKAGNRYSALLDSDGVVIFKGSGKHPNSQFSCKWSCEDLRLPGE